MKRNKENRSSLLVKNVVLSFVVKGWSALVVLLMVPLTLKMLGAYTNGVWLTISGILMWIDFMDIGLGNGLRNAVANYVAVSDDVKLREAVSSTFFMLVTIVVPVFLVLCGIVCFADLYGALGVSRGVVPDLDIALIVAALLACTTFVLKSIGNFYMGLQLPVVNSLIVSLGQTLALVLTFAAWLMGFRSLVSVVVVNVTSPLLVWLVSYPCTFVWKYPQYRPALKFVSMKMSKTLCNTGIQFFILQICAVVLFTSTNIIISRIFSPAEVTPYQVAYRYFSIFLVVFNTICMPFWNATTDAYARGDMAWIQRMSHKLNLLVLLVFAGLLVMVLLSDMVYAVWVGNEVRIPMSLSASTALYIFILCASMRYSYILSGLNVLRIQLVFTIAATIAYLPLTWLVCKTFGTVTSLVCVMCLVNVPGLIANMWKYEQILKKR